MGLICKLAGHHYEGCACTRCGAPRPEGHDWAMAEGKCERVCQRCGQTEEVPHEWFHCRCKQCGEQRDEQHLWLKKSRCEQVCRVCGKEREKHDWRPLDRGVDKCAVCGCTRRLTAEEVARRDEEWAASDLFEEPAEDIMDFPPEPD